MKKEITDLDDIKKIELGIMKQVHQFCEEKELVYYLAYGTLLGAVRHNGFIPWDDDIDIHMPRKDYIVFEKSFPEWGKNRGLYLAGPHNAEHYFPRAMCKVCDARTELIEESFNKYNKMGVFIDIWPLDNMPNNKLKAKAWMTLNYIKRQIILASVSNPSYKTGIKHIVCRLFENFETNWLVNSYDKSLSKLKDKKTKGCIAAQASNRIYDNKWFENRTKHRFEDAEFFIPEDFRKVLTKGYGDYMQLPPKEQQVPHHIINVWWKE